MANITKGSIVNMALRKAGLASTSVLLEPEPQSIMDGLEDLESMCATLHTEGLKMGYLFSPDPVPNGNEDSGLPLDHKMPLAYMLAKQMLVDNLRPVTDEVADGAYNGKVALAAIHYTPVYLQRRNDQPMGQGNNRDGSAYGRFYVQDTTEDGGGY